MFLFEGEKRNREEISSSEGLGLNSEGPPSAKEEPSPGLAESKEVV